jgi:hypothetical protein
MSATEWRAFSRPAVNYGSSAEQVARAAAQQINVNLESQCDLQETQWAARDEDWAMLMSIPYKPTRIARVDRQSIYLGAQPSLVAGESARFDKWPAITVRAGTRKATDDREQPDQYDVMDVELIVEVLTYAGPFRQDPLDDRSTSDAVDRQYQRLSDAVVGCVDQDRSLGYNFLSIKRPPTMTPSLPFVKKQTSGTGAFLVYQGMEILYIVQSSLY